MSVSSSTSTFSYTGNGSTTTAYTVPFNFYDAADLKVYSVDASGTSTLLTITTNYTVSGGGGSTGSVTTTAAIPSTRTVLIQRVVPYTQLTSFTTGDRLPANSIETALDKLTMEAQQLSRNTLPDTAITSGSAPYVLGMSSAGTSPYWVSQTASAIADGSITASKLSTGHPSWDASGNLTATSFVGNINGAVTATTGSFSGAVTVSGGITGNLTGTASALADGAVSSTAKLADGIVTKAKLATNEQKQIAKAWVNFDGTTAGTWAGGASTVSRAAGSATATITTTNAHGLVTGNSVWVIGTTVDSAAKAYTITVPSGSTTTFTIPTTATTVLTNATITFQGSTIRSHYNVSSITKNGTGDYTINYATALADANYSVSLCTQRGDGAAVFGSFGLYGTSSNGYTTLTTASVRILTGGTTYGQIDVPVVCAQVFGN